MHDHDTSTSVWKMQSCPCGSQPNELHESIQLGPVWSSYSNRSQSSGCMDLPYQYQYVSVITSQVFEFIWRLWLADWHCQPAPNTCNLQCLVPATTSVMLTMLEAALSFANFGFIGPAGSGETWANNSWRFRRVCQNFWVFEKDKMFAVSYWDPTRL